mgnify:CR=1 FL=1
MVGSCVQRHGPHPPRHLTRARTVADLTALGQDVYMIDGQRISVCIPARDEAATVGEIVQSVCGIDGVDEVLVLDHRSVDGTARIARDAGASVLDADGVMPLFGAAIGKGDVLWRSLAAASGDIVIWIDADLSTFTPQYVTALAQPFTDSNIHMVRGNYTRSFHGVDDEGGRVTELTARPLIAHLRPDLAHIRQPLAGEYAVRVSAARTLPFEVDYGVEIGLTLDMADAFGVDSIAQVDLGVRGHRNRPLAQLHEQALQVSRALLSRCGHPHLAIDSRPALAELDLHPEFVLGDQAWIDSTT